LKHPFTQTITFRIAEAGFVVKINNFTPELNFRPILVRLRRIWLGLDFFIRRKYNPAARRDKFSESALTRFSLFKSDMSRFWLSFQFFWVLLYSQDGLSDRLA
jgi:hypothetical protein